MNSHTNENIPSDLKVSRKGDLLVLAFRTATVTLRFDRRDDLVEALRALS